MEVYALIITAIAGAAFLALYVYRKLTDSSGSEHLLTSQTGGGSTRVALRENSLRERSLREPLRRRRSNKAHKRPWGW